VPSEGTTQADAESPQATAHGQRKPLAHLPTVTWTAQYYIFYMCEKRIKRIKNVQN